MASSSISRLKNSVVWPRSSRRRARADFRVAWVSSGSSPRRRRAGCRAMLAAFVFGIPGELSTVTRATQPVPCVVLPIAPSRNWKPTAVLIVDFSSLYDEKLASTLSLMWSVLLNSANGLLLSACGPSGGICATMSSIFFSISRTRTSRSAGCIALRCSTAVRAAACACIGPVTAPCDVMTVPNFVPGAMRRPSRRGGESPSSWRLCGAGGARRAARKKASRVAARGMCRQRASESH